MHQTGCLSRSKIAGLDQSHDTQVTMVTCKNARGRTKEVLVINYKSFVFFYQHGGNDVTCKPPTYLLMAELKDTLFTKLPVRVAKNKKQN